MNDYICNDLGCQKKLDFIRKYHVEYKIPIYYLNVLKKCTSLLFINPWPIEVFYYILNIYLNLCLENTRYLKVNEIIEDYRGFFHCENNIPFAQCHNIYEFSIDLICEKCNMNVCKDCKENMRTEDFLDYNYLCNDCLTDLNGDPYI